MPENWFLRRDSHTNQHTNGLILSETSGSADMHQALQLVRPLPILWPSWLTCLSGELIY